MRINMKAARIISEQDAPDLPWGTNRDCHSLLVIVETDGTQPPKYTRQPYCGLRVGEKIIEEIGDDNACPEDACLTRDFAWTADLLTRTILAEDLLDKIRAAVLKWKVGGLEGKLSDYQAIADAQLYAEEILEIMGKPE